MYIIYLLLVYSILNGFVISKEINKIISNKLQHNKSIVIGIEDILKEIREQKLGYVNSIIMKNNMSYTLDESCFLFPVFEVNIINDIIKFKETRR